MNKLFYIKYFAIYIALFFTTTNLKAQENEILCTKGLTYGELISLFEIKTSQKVFSTLQQKCFEEVENSTYVVFKTYERNYEKTEGNTITSYNELIQTKNGIINEYICSEMKVCNNLLKKIYDNMIYYYQPDSDENTYIYLLKDKLHVMEMKNIPENSIGFSYGFKYRNINQTDMNKLKDSKLNDSFPKNASERAKLEYRYEFINSENNSTSININAGDKIYFEAAGEISLGYFAGKSGINGIDGYENYNIVQGFKHGSLLYKIGSSPWNLIENEKPFIAKNSGNLQFIVNDKDTSNNFGEYWVNIKIIRIK